MSEHDPLRDGTSPATDPDPSETPGLEPGGGVAPGDTPPVESSVSGLSYDQDVRAPNAGGRSVAVVLGIIVALIVVGTVLAIIFH